MRTILMFIHIAVSLGLIALVLLQHGRGADAGAAFGSGASQTLFGARGSSSFLTRSTALLAAIFFTTSLTLAYLSGYTQQRRSVTELMSPAPVVPTPDETTDLPASQVVVPPSIKVAEPPPLAIPEDSSIPVLPIPAASLPTTDSPPTEKPPSLEPTPTDEATTPQVAVPPILPTTENISLPVVEPIPIVEVESESSPPTSTAIPVP